MESVSSTLLWTECLGPPPAKFMYIEALTPNRMVVVLDTIGLR